MLEAGIREVTGDGRIVELLNVREEVRRTKSDAELSGLRSRTLPFTSRAEAGRGASLRGTMTNRVLIY